MLIFYLYTVKFSGKNEYLKMFTHYTVKYYLKNRNLNNVKKDYQKIIIAQMRANSKYFLPWYFIMQRILFPFITVTS